MTTKLTERSEWKALEAHYAKMKSLHLRELFSDTARAEAFTLAAGDLRLDLLAGSLQVVEGEGIRPGPAR